MLEDEKCAVKCLGAMDRALAGRRSRRGTERSRSGRGVTRRDGRPDERNCSHPLAEETGATSSSKAPFYSTTEELLGVTNNWTLQLMVPLNDIACSPLMETRTDTELPEEEFLALAEATFMCS